MLKTISRVASNHHAAFIEVDLASSAGNFEYGDEVQRTVTGSILFYTSLCRDDIRWLS